MDFEFEVKPSRELYLLRGSLARAPPQSARVAATVVRFGVSPQQKNQLAIGLLNKMTP